MKTVDDTLSERKAMVMRSALEQGLLSEERLLAGFLDLDNIGRTVSTLQAAFGDHFLHAFAAKANCLHRVLVQLREAGMGCEVASPGELEQAVRAGFPPELIVFDSPAKTLGEIGYALTRGIAVNIDNFQEFERVRAHLQKQPSVSVIGFRLNPQVGVGTIAAMSTATRTSKFGVALDDERERLLQAYMENPWLSCVHTHIGSQGCPFELIVHGIGKAVEFAETVNAKVGRQQVKVLDIGGGLPVNFEGEEVKPTFEEYAGYLRDGVPLLFSGRYRVITEFGRSVMAKNGFIAARVEYTKVTGERHIAITHAGAQTATRTVFMPDMWAIRLSALDARGRLKSGENVPQDVAGPCCFAGDILAHNRPLPLLEPGDYILAHDTGAYYFSTPFHYNSLPNTAVYGFRIEAGGAVSFEEIRAEETLGEIAAATGAPPESQP